MSYGLGSKSRANLNGVHPNLVRVVERAIQITPQDFTVQEGLRTVATQRLYVQRGVSKTMNSKHLVQPDGFGHAVDLVPWINGQPRWEAIPCIHIAAAMRQAAKELQTKLTWGAVWDRDFDQLPEDFAGLQQAVNSYVTRRRGIGKSAFLDFPHYQLG